MKLKYLFLISIFLTGYLSREISLESDNIVQAHFDKSEIQHLSEILSFFDQQVQNIVNAENVVASYNKFFRVIEDSAKAGTQYYPILQISSDDLEQLMSSIPRDFKNEIWGSYYSIHNPTNDSSLTIDLKTKGKYYSFLKSAGQKSDIIERYFESLKHGGIIGPSMIAEMIMNYDELNLKLERERLIVAIHYLTLRQTAEVRKPKYRTKNG